MEAVLEKKRLYSFEEYLDMEEKSEVKHEFHNGKLIPMAGGTINHNTIGSNIQRVIGNCLVAKDKPCTTLTSDQKIHVPATGKAVYPDVTVYCGEPQLYPGRKTVITNPLLIVEVLSDETEDYDRNGKFDNYCSIPSFLEYVLVAQDKPCIEVFYLFDPAAGLWKKSSASGLEGKIKLRSVGCVLALKDVYRMVKGLPAS